MGNGSGGFKVQADALRASAKDLETIAAEKWSPAAQLLGQVTLDLDQLGLAAEIAGMITTYDNVQSHFIDLAGEAVKTLDDAAITLRGVADKYDQQESDLQGAIGSIGERKPR